VDKIKKEDSSNIPVEKNKAKIVEKVKAFGAESSDEEEEEVRVENRPILNFMNIFVKYNLY